MMPFYSDSRRRVNHIKPLRQLVLFVCNGEVHPNCLDDFHPDSYLKKGVLRTFCEHSKTTPITYQDECFDDNDACMEDEDTTNQSDSDTANTTWQLLYGFKFSARTALSVHTDRLFLLSRQSINYVLNNVEQGSFTLGEVNSNESRELQNRREQIKAFLDYTNGYLEEHVPKNLGDFCNLNANDANALMKKLVENIQIILTHIGPLSELPRHCLQNSASRHGNKSGTGFYHTLHMYLDIYWSLLELVYRILDTCPDLDIAPDLGVLLRDFHLLQSQDQIEQDLFQQIVDFYIRDLTAVACRRFAILTFSDYTKVSPFSCTCVKEFWTMLIQVLRNRQRLRGGRSFWHTFYRVFEEYSKVNTPELTARNTAGSASYVGDPNGTVKNIAGFSFWMILHLAPLYQFDDMGCLIIGQRYFEADHDEVVGQMKKLLTASDSQLTEEELRCYLQCCIRVCRLWKADMALVNVLWNYFFRKLNNHFKIATMGIAGMQTIKKTTRGLFEECQKLSSNNSDVAVATPSKDNSFHMFLRLTCYQLNEISNSENTSAWRNFKGRLLSKFHQRGMQELTESGLTHFTQLFLTLALCTHDEQLLVSLCDFYNMVDFHVADTRRRCTIWKGIFAAMFISIQWKSDLSILAERLTPLFGFVCNKFGSPTMEPQKRHQLWEILTIYIDGLQEIVDSSPELTLSEYKLVTKDFAMVLHVGRNFEMCSIFGLFNVVLSKLLSLVRTQRENEGDIFIPNDHHEQMAQSLWVNIFPFVESHAKTQTALLEVADLAAQFLILSLTLPDWSPCFSSVFGKFVCDSSVNTQVTCRFLGHVLAEHAVTESLEASESKSPLKDSLQIKLIHSWLRCCLLLGPVSSTQLQAVTSHILRLPAVVRICNLVDNDLVSAGSDNTVVELFKVFGKAHDNAADWESKMKLKEEVKLFVGEICLCIQPLLKSPQSADLLRHVYTVVGHLVKYCAPLLFNDPRLQETIDSLIFPHSLFVPSKPLNPFIQTALYDTLHLFVSGLHKVNSRYAPYVQRRLRDVILQYLPRFPLKRGTTSGEPTSLMSPQLKPHPLVRILTDFLISNSIHNIGSFRQFVLVTTRENLLKVEGLKLSESASLGLSFIVEIVEKTERTEDLARDMAPLLSSLLECYLLAKNPQLKQSTTQILTLLLRASCQHPDMAPKKDLLEILGTFLRSYFPLFSNSLFHLWEKLLPLYPELLADNVPQLTAALKELELKRGSGTDNNLRLQWVAYLTKMGKTQEEIKALL